MTGVSRRQFSRGDYNGYLMDSSLEMSMNTALRTKCHENIKLRDANELQQEDDETKRFRNLEKYSKEMTGMNENYTESGVQLNILIKL